MQMIIVGKGITAWLSPQKEHMLHNIFISRSSSRNGYSKGMAKNMNLHMNQVRMKMLNA